MNTINTATVLLCLSFFLLTGCEKSQVETAPSAQARKVLFVFSAILAFVGFGMNVPALPSSECVDTEVSTNFVFAVGEGGGRRLQNVNVKLIM